MIEHTEEPTRPWDALARAADEFRTPCGEGEMVWRSWGRGGTPLVLLHGGAGSWLHWLRTIPAFAWERRVVVADLPGLGSSAVPPSGADGHTIAEIVATGLRRVIGPDEPADLVGFSFGGVMAGLVAGRATTRTRSLTLVGSGGLGVILSSAKLERVRDKTGTERDEAHRTNLHRWMIADPAAIDSEAVAIQDWNSRHARLDSRPIGVSDILLPVLPTIAAPVVGIWGDADHAVQGETERVEAALLPVCRDLTFRVVPHAGHWVAYEAPEAFEQTLRTCLNAVGSWGGASR